MHLDLRQLSVGVDLRLASRANWLAGRDLVEVARWGHWMSEAVVANDIRARLACIGWSEDTLH